MFDSDRLRRRGAGLAGRRGGGADAGAAARVSRPGGGRDGGCWQPYYFGAREAMRLDASDRLAALGLACNAAGVPAS